ncbi:MAG TPA: hypothetical protein ENI90_02005, partial [Methylothermaceae bacterium]|nr:hypothetical protein [Methylothermaceae bacterium]
MSDASAILLEEFARRQDLQIGAMDEEGWMTLRVDKEMEVHVRVAGDLVLEAEVACLPEAGRESTLEKLLQVAFTRFRRQPEVLFLKGDILYLRRTLILAGLSVVGLEEALEGFLNALEFWRRQLSLSIPATLPTG